MSCFRKVTPWTFRARLDRLHRFKGLLRLPDIVSEFVKAARAWEGSTWQCRLAQGAESVQYITHKLYQGSTAVAVGVLWGVPRRRADEVQVIQDQQGGHALHGFLYLQEEQAVPVWFLRSH